jgi:putative phosphoesterase
VKLGVISDTHDFLDPKIPQLFSGVDHILHAGDIGKPSLLLQLESIAPVIAVGGNTDDPSFRYRETQIAQLGGRKFLVHHIVDPRALRDDLKARIQRDKPDAVIFGHTHKPCNETIDGILFFNPGYAGKNKFGLQRSVAILRCDKKIISAEFLPL